MNILTRFLDQSGLFLRDLNSTTPKGLSYLLGGLPTASGKQVSQKASIGLSAIYHAVDLISLDYASLNTIIYQSKGNEREILTHHNVYKLLNWKPNYYQTPIEYKRMLAVHRLMYGNSYAIIDRFEGSAEIRNLLPVHPDNVGDIVDVDSELFYNIKGVDLPIPGRDMIHVKDLSIENGSFKGTSRIDYAREDIGKALALNEYASNFFGNGANVGNIFESELGALENEEQRVSISNAINSKHVGNDKAHQHIVLPSGFKLSSGPTQFNQEQTQFIQTKAQTVEEAAQLFNLPLNKMRIRESGTSYNSQEQSNIEYVTDLLRPFSIAYQQENNIKLFNSTDSGAVFTRDSLEDRMKGDMATQGEFIDKMIKNGTYSVNQALHFLGQNGIGDAGDKHMIQSNQMELGQTGIKED